MRTIVSLFFVFLASLSFGQTSTGRITTKYDMRRHVDGRYQGLAYGEYRISLDWDGGDSGQAFQYHLEELKRDGRLEARALVDRRSAEIRLGQGNFLIIPPEKDVVVFQNFPALPQEPLALDLSWQATGHILVDPLQSGEMTRVPILVAYEVLDLRQYNGELAWEIKSQYALRYRGEDYYGDPQLKRITGSHSSIIYIRHSDNAPIFFRTTAEEQYQLQGNRSLEQRGFILTWFEDVPGFSGQETTTTITETIEEEELEDIEIEEVEEGLRLRIKNLLFVPDQPILLPGEEERLDGIVEVLEKFPGRRFLIVGHTADIGTQESQLILSRERARSIVDQLVNRGIPAENLMYQGVGGTEPLGENSTEEGRRINRRVEITILER
jgi:OOP family OmpA-OmpF porin